MSPRCSIVVPVHDQVALTRQCLDTILSQAPDVSFEIIVVDDASTDSTQSALKEYGDAVKVVTRRTSGGFAAACNDGASVARGEYLVFLNNDTTPKAGWLDALVADSEQHPAAAVVGSKLLFPNDTVQHAGVVICQDGHPRHLYAGFPADHPATSKSRRFQAVTAACALVRRQAFEEAGGFDTAFRNALEDVDLCLRLAELGYQTRYCAESVLYHLESASRGRGRKNAEPSVRLFQSRWGSTVERDDLKYYTEDGLLGIRYHDAYSHPLRIDISPVLAVVNSNERQAETERLLDARSREALDLLREAVRLTIHIADLELAGGGPERLPGDTRQERTGGEPRFRATQHELSRRLEETELRLLDLQNEVAAAASENHSGDSSAVDAPRKRFERHKPFEPSEYLRYRKLLGDLRHAVATTVPSGSTVLVVSRGDDELLDLDELDVRHFPQTEDGTYAGSYPSDSATAIAHLEELRAGGAQFLVFPRTTFWWLDHYRELQQHLDDHYARILSKDTCVVFDLEAG